MNLILDHFELAERVLAELLPEAFASGVKPEDASGLLTAVESSFGTKPQSVEQLEMIVSTYGALRQVEACFKKRRDPGPVPQKLVEEAKEHFFQLESENYEFQRTAERDNKLSEIRHVIASILPPLDWVWDDIWPNCGFGPGATFAGSGRDGKHLLSKIGGAHTVTRACAPLYLDVIRNFFPRLATRLADTDTISIVKGNRLSFVPKEATKCRTIAIEPSCNMFLQKGIGAWMLQRLKRFGIDLNDQSRNVKAAQAGSVDGHLATIDLSDASSRITRHVVRSLLPPDWFALLDVVRSPQFTLDKGKTWQAYNMFCSQGNSFTFPLETIIFYAIARVYSEGYSSPIVYGDDIIVETACFPAVCAALERHGFKVNEKKSFGTGFFRESCGGDFLFGRPVRPIYYKKAAECYSEIATIHNLLQEKWGYQLQDTLGWLRSLVPSGKRIEGPLEVVRSIEQDPFGNSDVSFDGWFALEDFAPRARYHEEWQCLVYTQNYWSVRARPQRRKYSEETRLLCFLYGGSESLESSSDTKKCVRKVILPTSALRSKTANRAL